MCSCVSERIVDFLKAIYARLGAAGSDKVAGTVTTAIATGSGSVTAGAVFVSFDNTGVTNVTVNGQILKPDRSRVFPTSDGMKLPSINYDATSGNLTIDATYPPT